MDAAKLPTNLNVRRLVWLRTIAIPGPAICLLIVGQIYELSIPTIPLVLIVAGLGLVNVWTWRRLNSPRPISNEEFFVQMLVDVAALTGILYFSGGASNPFAFFFLLPLTITATILTPAYTWAMAAITAACYSLLMFARVPVPELIPGGEQTIFGLHVAGMWLGFVMIAGLISHYVVGMGETLRDRDRRLAEAREQALNSERMVELGTLAAGAAHELSTPLGTMAVLAGEMGDEYPEKAHPHLHQQIQLLRDQVARCKDALSVLSASAGLDRAEGARALRLDAMVENVVDQVRSLRPGAIVNIEYARQEPAPALIVERTLTQALVNILHNAVDASPNDVNIRCGWDNSRATIEFLDRGPGFDPDLMDPERAGRSTKANGLGVGLFISRAAIDQFGGQLTMSGRDGGGTATTVDLPLAETSG